MQVRLFSSGYSIDCNENKGQNDVDTTQTELG